MKKIILYFLLLQATIFAWSTPPSYELTQDFWNNPNFVRSFMGDYGFRSEVEPENIYIDNSYYSPYYSGWYPYYYGRNYRRISHTTSEGVLYIDLIDTKSKQLIWQGKGIGFLSSNGKTNRDELVDNYVSKILSVFPPEIETTLNQ